MSRASERHVETRSSGVASGDATQSDGPMATVAAWFRRTEWLWMIIGGFYLIAYLFWYLPALAALPESVRSPPEQFPWHWPLDFASTGLAGGVLLALGFRRAAAFADTSPGEPDRENAASDTNRRK